ncbi:MAG: hypothetical protein ETSY1_46985 (plasmid) [Candidatus Entotheonella factor]|uniref:Uncharacterized protein n=1 Tax=Entotheonella factor TaxID=1429438 RepID=W4M020_ENTF1|nr:MAG: hypothetical protein ETSY1_46985 [Candidatus Entotheonella factor]
MTQIQAIGELVEQTSALLHQLRATQHLDVGDERQAQGHLPPSQLSLHGVDTQHLVLSGTTQETPIWSFDMPAGQWQPGDQLRLLVAGRVDGTAGIKRFRLRVNGGITWLMSMPTLTQHPWYLEAWLTFAPESRAILVLNMIYRVSSRLHTTETIPLDTRVANQLSIGAQTVDATDSVTKSVSWTETVHHPLL